MAYNDGNLGATPVEAGEAPGPSTPWWQPPVPPEQQRHRFGWAKVVVALVVILALVAAGLGARAYVHRSSVSSNEAAVRRAYLGWWSARQGAYLQLDPSGLKALMTPAGYQQEAAQVRQQAATGDPFHLVADHNLQVAVYSGSPYASVDDVWNDHSVALDPATRQPVQPDPDITIEDSATLKQVGGHWLVGDVVRFGVSRPESGQNLSYVAADSASPAEAAEVANSFIRYRRTLDSALASLNTSALPGVATGTQLGTVEALVAKERSKGESGNFQDQDSVRVGLQDSNNVWISDTDFGTYSLRSKQSGKTIGRPVSGLYRGSYELTRESTGWKVENSITY